jgi:hypothetical protein
MRLPWPREFSIHEDAATRDILAPMRATRPYFDRIAEGWSLNFAILFALLSAAALGMLLFAVLAFPRLAFIEVGDWLFLYGFMLAAAVFLCCTVFGLEMIRAVTRRQQAKTGSNPVSD